MKTQNLSKLIFSALLAAASLLPSCKKETENLKTGGTATSSMVQTSLTGVVVDENNAPVQGASIVAYGKSSVTDSKGIFVITSLGVDANRCYLKVNKTGYFPASKAVVAVKNGITQVRVMMLDNQPHYSVNSSTGGSAVLSNGCKVDLPANAVVDASGNSYSGTINIAIKHLDPSSTDFGYTMPGDLQAIRTDGSTASLMSYGMLGVELTGTSGQKLQIANGKQATIAVTVPSAMLGSAPSSIPLWHFDESAGIWKEDGEAVLTGNQYVGNVSHFSFWGCWTPYPSATIRGRVVDCNGNPMPGIYMSSSNGGSAITDANGEFCELAPATIAFDLYVYPQLNFGTSIPPVSVGPLTAGATYTVPDITIACPAEISGTIVDCDNNPTAGTVYIIWNNGWNFVTTSNGSFTIPAKAGQLATIYAYSTSGASNIGVAVTTPAMGATSSVGDLMACITDMRNSFYINGGTFNNELVVIHPEPGSGSEYYTGNNFTYAYASDVATFNGFYIAFPGNSTGNFNITNTGGAYFYIYYSGLDSTFAHNIALNVQQYDNVGGMVSGEFSGTIQDQITATTYTISEGKFSVIRRPDY